MDKKAIAEEFYTKYREKVYYYVYSKIFDKNDVEDVVSEVFLKASLKAETYDPAKSAMSTWIYTIAHNVVVDYIKKRKIRTAELDPNLVSDEDPERDCIAEERSRRLAALLERLTERERDLVLLRYYEGYNAAEIAKITKLEHSNVRIILMRAREKLKNLLKDEDL